MAARLKIVDISAVFEQNPLLTPEGQSKALASFARKRIAEIDGDNARIIGRRVSYETFVDGSPSDALSRVKPNGVIVAKWRLGLEVVEYVWDLVHKSGPVSNTSHAGRYRRSARIFADQKEVDSPKDAIGASEVVIVPTVPYARKIERGRKGYAPGKVYEGVYALANARYGNVAKIRYVYQGLIGGSSMMEDWAREHSGKVLHAHKRKQQYRKDVRNPAILILF